jgi:hypothetical protein
VKLVIVNQSPRFFLGRVDDEIQMYAVSTSNYLFHDRLKEAYQGLINDRRHNLKEREISLARDNPCSIIPGS